MHTAPFPTPATPLLRRTDGYHLDTRAAGGETLPAVLDGLRLLQPGEHLLVHTLFAERSLLLLAQRMGFRCEMNREGVDHWVVRIRRED